MLRIGSPIPHKHSRIEIIPLIDIMFFLLASFMMVSLQMSKTENIRVQLPEATQGKSDFQPNMINIAVNKDGLMFYEKIEVDGPKLSEILSNRFQMDTNLPVYISGDTDTQHGAMVKVYELVRSAGVQKIAFCVTAESPAAGGPNP